MHNLLFFATNNFRLRAIVVFHAVAKVRFFQAYLTKIVNFISSTNILSANVITSVITLSR